MTSGTYTYRHTDVFGLAITASMKRGGEREGCDGQLDWVCSLTKNQSLVKTKVKICCKNICIHRYTDMGKYARPGGRRTL